MNGILPWWMAVSIAGFEDGSLVILDDTLDVNVGGTVNLWVKLGARPRSDVTVALAETSALISLGESSLTFTRDNWDTYQSVAVSGIGNRQTGIALPNSRWTGAQWLYGASRPQIDAGLVPVGETAFFGSLAFELSGGERVGLGFESTVQEPSDRADLTAAFEDNGAIEVTFGGSTYTFSLDGADMEEPYVWHPSNSSDANTLRLALAAASDRTATLALRDYTPGDATISLSASGPDEYESVTASATVTVA